MFSGLKYCIVHTLPLNCLVCKGFHQSPTKLQHLMMKTWKVWDHLLQSILIHIIDQFSWYPEFNVIELRYSVGGWSELAKWMPLGPILATGTFQAIYLASKLHQSVTRRHAWGGDPNEIVPSTRGGAPDLAVVNSLGGMGGSMKRGGSISARDKVTPRFQVVYLFNGGCAHWGKRRIYTLYVRVTTVSTVMFQYVVRSCLMGVRHGTLSLVSWVRHSVRSEYMYNCTPRDGICVTRLWSICVKVTLGSSRPPTRTRESFHGPK